MIATVAALAACALCAALSAPITLLAMATLLSEDLTCIAAGELIRRGEITAFTGVFGCFAGIYAGDLLLWALGRAVGPRVLGWRWIGKRVSRHRVEQLGDWFDRRAPLAVISARFMPGMRLPVYLGAGLLNRNGARFAFWTFIAAAIWTPLLVLLVGRAGSEFIAPLERYTGGGWIAVASVVIAGVGLVRLTVSIVSSTRRAKLMARISKIWRWEFWPMWLFYLPVLPWIAWLSIKHRSFMIITAANPGIPLGGFVGESKLAIMRSIKHPAAIETKCARDMTFDFPAILKPDVGQRGAGVKLVRSIDEAREYLSNIPGEIVAQPFHPGPFEAGVFYYRIPGESCGEIFSITDKVFSHLTGDGESTVEELIWRHPRFRMQAATFLSRHHDAKDHILACGETFELALAGNHCQGTMFRDGAHLITPALERAIDEIAKSFDGFYFGRFDVRYSDVAQFKMGRDITVIELNGVTSESTNIYDPGWSLRRAYRTLMRQWTILFEIAAANAARGRSIATARELVHAIRQHLRADAYPN